MLVFVWLIFDAMLASMMCNQGNTQLCWVSNYYYLCIWGFIYLWSASEGIEKSVLSSTDNCSHIPLNMLSACMFLRASFSGKECIISFYLPLSLLAFKGCEYIQYYSLNNETFVFVWKHKIISVQALFRDKEKKSK